MFGKDSRSSYELNGRTVAREEVVSKLKSKKVDLNNNRFMILQGEVEMISMMKPKTGKAEDPGLLEYLEEIIGTNAYLSQLEALGASFLEAKRGKDSSMLLLSDSKKDLSGWEEKKLEVLEVVRAEKVVCSLNHLVYSLMVIGYRKKIVERNAKVEVQGKRIEELKKEKKEMVIQQKAKLLEFKALAGQKDRIKEEISDQGKKRGQLETRDKFLGKKLRLIMVDESNSDSKVERL